MPIIKITGERLVRNEKIVGNKSLWVKKSQNLIWLILTIQYCLVDWIEERKRKFWKIKIN